MGTQHPKPKGAEPHPIFGPRLWPNGCMDQDATWTEVGLGLRNIVFDVDPATPRKKGTPTPRNCGPCLLWTNGWMDEDAVW